MIAGTIISVLFCFSVQSMDTTSLGKIISSPENIEQLVVIIGAVSALVVRINDLIVNKCCKVSANTCQRNVRDFCYLLCRCYRITVKGVDYIDNT